MTFLPNPTPTRTALTPLATAADPRQYQDLGVRHFILSSPTGTSDEQQAAMERFAREVTPLLLGD